MPWSFGGDWWIVPCAGEAPAGEAPFALVGGLDVVDKVEVLEGADPEGVVCGGVEAAAHALAVGGAGARGRGRWSP